MDEYTVRELLEYFPETGKLYWKPRSREWFQTERSMKYFNNRFAGKEAGSIKSRNNDTYHPIQVKIDGRLYFAHRLIWLYMQGVPIPDQIDHINGDASDNRWNNLRASYHEQNMRNKKKYSNNESGITGVRWNKSKSRWVAYCQDNGKHKHLGSFKTKEEAIQMLKSYRESIGYHENHGRS